METGIRHELVSTRKHPFHRDLFIAHAMRSALTSIDCTWRFNMRFVALLALAGSAASPALAGPNVGISIGINQPGVYGRVDIGNYPQPVVVYPQPVVVAPAPVAVYQQPIYLYVPVQYQRNWPRYCGRYNACGQPVYFVQEQWVQERYRQEHGDRRGERGERHEHRDHDEDRDRNRHGNGHRGGDHDD